MNMISEGEAIQTICGSPGKFALHLGAGVSASAGVPLASEICNEIRRSMAKTLADEGLPPEEISRQIDERLDWKSPEQRYSTCIQKGLASKNARIDYFRALLKDKRPGFSHHAVALLMQHGKVRRTCLTTNFDKLITSAFFSIGRSEYQPIRTPGECGLWVPEQDKCFGLMLHGDYETRTMRNLQEETGNVPQAFGTAVRDLLKDSGLVVLGAAGHEASIGHLMEELASDESSGAGVLGHGLLWGVYVGEDDDPMAALQRALDDGHSISRRIVQLFRRSQHKPFAFFPIRSSDAFFHRLIRRFEDKILTRASRIYLDHGPRVRQMLGDAGFDGGFIRNHLERIEKARTRATRGSASDRLDTTLALFDSSSEQSVVFVYGDITNERLAQQPRLAERKRAIVSSDDTFFTAGGGVALSILRKAGPHAILNELEKFPKPEALGNVVTTSSGSLLTHYVMHAAVVGLEPKAGGAYIASVANIRAAMRRIVAQMDAMEIGAVYVPILGAGLADIDPGESLGALLDVIQLSGDKARGATFVVIIFSRAQLAPERLEQLATNRLSRFRAASSDDWQFDPPDLP